MPRGISGFGAPIAVILLACAACSRQGGVSPPVSPTPGTPTPAAPLFGTKLTNVNVVANDVGGGIEELTANFGPGFTGRRMVDGLLTPSWQLGRLVSFDPVAYPQEIVFSFYERKSALVGALVVVLPEPATWAPKDVEVWTSPDSPTEHFTKTAAATLEAKSGEQTVTFTPVEARYVKLRVMSGASKESLEIAEVRVLEALRRDYAPLFTRTPGVKYWKGGPREAAQRGLEWLQQAAPNWGKYNNCFGCHVQSQVLMGQAVALKMGYRVNMPALRLLDDFTRRQTDVGTWFGASHSASVFGAMGLAYAAQATGITSDKGQPETRNPKGLLLEAADHLVAIQAADGAIPVDQPAAPIVQGQFMTTSNALVALDWAATHSGDPTYQQAIARGVEWIAANEPATNQDKVFKIIALMRDGTPEQKRTAWSVVEELSAEQQPDGGWKESAATKGSNAIATGQVLYAFKQAGVSIRGPMFRRGVDYLLKNQVNEPTPDNGLWKSVNTQSERPSNFAHTMWAVIGLAGSYGADPTGALQIVKQQGEKPPTRNLEIVLDVSGSMNTALGTSTRWKTALEVLKQVVDTLPDDFNVALRVYGHRYSSKSAETCTDTELVVPLAKLDRARVLSQATRLRPRGETPLVRSILQTMGDLRAGGGGAVILITDGEESCKGDPTAAAAELKASGLDVTLNIVGFTLTGKDVEAQLSTLAGSTGGRYFGAQDGAQLSRALMLASLQRLPYDIVDAAGKMIVSGETSPLGRELPPGSYRLRIDALGQALEAPVTIVPNQTTSLTVAVVGDRFIIRQ
jgi:hypothetical protein